MTYEKYVELLSKCIVAKQDMTPKDFDQIMNFESNQPVKCPHCAQTVISPFQPKRIVHDVQTCSKAVKSV